MTAPDLSRTQRLVNFGSPFFRLWRRERDDHAATRAELSERDGLIKMLDLELGVTKARLRLANQQRDRARDLAAALVGDAGWSAGDVEFLHDAGVEPA